MGSRRRKGKSSGIIEGSSSITGSFIADQLTKNLQESTKRVLHDTNQLARVIEQYEKTGRDKVQGRALEFLEVLKFDREAAEKWRFDLKAKPTHFTDPHNSSDIQIFKNEEVVGNIQSKSRATPAEAIIDHSDPKYHGMGRLNPLDQHEKIKELLHKKLEDSPSDQLFRERYEDIDKNLVKSISYEDVDSGGTTRAEAEFAAEHPHLVQMMYDGEAVIKELGISATEGAAVTVGTTVVIKSLLNTAEYIRGKKELAETLSDVFACTSSAAIKGGVVASTAQGVQLIVNSVADEGVSSLSHGAAPIAIASSIFDMGYATRKFVKGEINKDEFKEACGMATMKGVATYYCGVVGQILIPIPFLGAMVGSIVGYTTASMLVQAGVLGVGPKNLVEVSRKRREYIEKECMRAIELMSFYKIQFEAISQYFDEEYSKIFIPQIINIEHALHCYSPNEIINCIALLNESFSNKLQFRTFIEFDDFMRNPNSKLII